MENNSTSDIKNLEMQTGLNKKELIVLRAKVYNEPIYYITALHILIDGTGALGKTITYTDQETSVTKTLRIDESHIQTIYSIQWSNLMYKKLKTKTPAGKNGFFDEDSLSKKEGVILINNSERVDSNPIIGPSKTTPSLTEYLMNSVHPKFYESVEKYCNMIRSRAYLALPAALFGSVQSVVAKIQGLAASIQKLIFNVYQGCIRAIQEFYAYINGIIVKIQRLMVNLIEQIIPLDLICLLFETIQVLLDDINFFSSLFGQNGNVFQYLNTFQNGLNLASTFVSNPFTTISAYLPPSIKENIDLIAQIGADPNGFLADQLANYGYSYVLNALQGDILGAAINKFGPQYAAIGAVSQVLNAAENYPRSLGQFPKTPAVIGPNVYTRNERKVDSNLNPFETFRQELSDFFVKK
jgi:hypothetical protein